MKKYMFSAGFFSAMLPLAIPIALQNLLSASFRMVDTLMIGRLGDTPLAAVGLAGNLSFFVELIAFGIASGSAVFMAQYHGAGNDSGIRRSFASGILCIIPFSLISIVSTLLFPEEIMKVLTDNGALIAEGARYLRYCCFSYLGIMLGLVTSTALRTTENVRLPLIASGIAAVTNAVLNYILIFGKLGLPAMGVAGAGLATTISSLIGPIIMLTVSIIHKNILYAPLGEFLRLRGFFSVYFKKVFPVLCNELFWSLSIVGLNMVFGRMGEDNYAALTVYRTVENIVFVFFIGVCHACNILVGMRIGANRIEEAKRLARQFMLFIPLLGAVLGLVAVLLRNQILDLFDISASARSAAIMLIIIFAFDVGPRNIPYLAVVGIFRAGGDTKVGLIGDIGVNYLLVLPTAIIAGLVFNLPFITTYLLTIIVDDVSKCFIYLPYFVSMKWVKPIDQ